MVIAFTFYRRGLFCSQQRGSEWPPLARPCRSAANCRAIDTTAHPWTCVLRAHPWTCVLRGLPVDLCTYGPTRGPVYFWAYRWTCVLMGLPASRCWLWLAALSSSLACAAWLPFFDGRDPAIQNVGERTICQPEFLEQGALSSAREHGEQLIT